jgi:hypothetical protein
MFEEAKEIGLKVPRGIPNTELRALIDGQPATPEQRKIASEILRIHFPDRKCPDDLTYGAARRLLETEKEIQNSYTINENKLEERQCIKWEGKYYYIERIYGGCKNYRMRLRKVSLSRSAGADRAKMTPIEDKSFVMNSRKVYLECEVIDLDTWQPHDDDFWPSSSPEDPPF